MIRPHNSLHFLLFCTLVLVGCSSRDVSRKSRSEEGLTVFALGDAGEKTSELRANAKLIRRMQTGEHDGGRADVMIFLGDNFYDTGLNVPVRELRSRINSILGLFEEPMADLGPSNVHAVAGNHDYYTHHAFSTSALFGLINVEMGPIGMSDRGNQREAAIKEWSYYYHYPSSARYAVGSLTADSVEFIFFDSARMLRTDPASWKPALDSLTTLLRSSGGRQGVRWRVLAVHHPFYSLGEHGGYTFWNDEINDVEYLTSCDKDSNALGWFKNLVDPEDLCTEKYRRYKRSMKDALHEGGAKIHLVLSGHDHSLQLLSYPSEESACAVCPSIHVVSGSASKTTMVRKAVPPNEFTSTDPNSKDGTSLHGFAQIRFTEEEIRVAFFRGGKDEVIDMGGGRSRFRIGADGRLKAE